MTRTSLLYTCVAVAGLALAMPDSVMAEQAFKEIGMELSDGKDGRPFAKWTQTIKEKPVKKVVAIVKKVSGGDDTFVNLRFGDGKTLDGGKRIHLKDNKKQKVSWDVGEQSANGKPLVLNAYKGVVLLKRVNVHYKGK